MKHNVSVQSLFNHIKTAVDVDPWAKEMVEELLKEQEPVAVYECKVNKCVCGNEINRYWHPEYCGFCGKKLLWY